MWDIIACWPSARFGEVVTITCPTYFSYFSDQHKGKLSYDAVCCHITIQSEILHTEKIHSHSLVCDFLYLKHYLFGHKQVHRLLPFPHWPARFPTVCWYLKWYLYIVEPLANCWRLNELVATKWIFKTTRHPTESPRQMAHRKSGYWFMSVVKSNSTSLLFAENFKNDFHLCNGPFKEREE